MAVGWWAMDHSHLSEFAESFAPRKPTTYHHAVTTRQLKRGESLQFCCWPVPVVVVSALNWSAVRHSIKQTNRPVLPTLRSNAVQVPNTTQYRSTQPRSHTLTRYTLRQVEGEHSQRNNTYTLLSRQQLQHRLSYSTLLSTFTIPTPHHTALTAPPS